MGTRHSYIWSLLTTKSFSIYAKLLSQPWSFSHTNHLSLIYFPRLQQSFQRSHCPTSKARQCAPCCLVLFLVYPCLHTCVHMSIHLHVLLPDISQGSWMIITKLDTVDKLIMGSKVKVIKGNIIGRACLCAISCSAKGSLPNLTMVTPNYM